MRQEIHTAWLLVRLEAIVGPYTHFISSELLKDPPHGRSEEKSSYIVEPHFGQTTIWGCFLNLKKSSPATKPKSNDRGKRSRSSSAGTID